MVPTASCIKGFAHSKAEDYFTERFFFVLVAFLFGHHEIVAFFGFCCWKTDYSPRIGKLWLSCTLVYELQDLMEAFGGKKNSTNLNLWVKMKLQRVHPMTFQLRRVLRQQMKWPLPGSAESVPTTMLDHRPHVPRSATSSSGLVHDFGEFLQNSVCSWQKNHCCFGSDRQWECTPESGESVFREQRQRWLCESGQD